jgi:hypothetical protein
MILAGSCLGAFVLAAWPEPTTRLTRLPHGESSPKTPIVAVQRRAPAQRVVASVGVAQPQREPDEENVERELAGPPPVAAESESGGYRPETPEELGAKPLPGMHPSVPVSTLEAAPTP